MAINTIGNASAPSAAPAPAPHQGAPGPAVRTEAVVSEPAPQQPPKPEHVQKAVESLKQLVEAKAPNSLSFSIDSETGKTVVKVSDAKTGEMIRQIPSQELLDIARSLDKLQGMLLQQKA